MDNHFWIDEVVRKYFETNSLEQALKVTNQEKRLYELSKTVKKLERRIQNGKTLVNSRRKFS